jgi:hypothetical protein
VISKHPTHLPKSVKLPNPPHQTTPNKRPTQCIHPTSRQTHPLTHSLTDSLTHSPGAQKKPTTAAQTHQNPPLPIHHLNVSSRVSPPLLLFLANSSISYQFRASSHHRSAGLRSWVRPKKGANAAARELAMWVRSDLECVSTRMRDAGDGSLSQRSGPSGGWKCALCMPGASHAHMPLLYPPPPG